MQALGNRSVGLRTAGPNSVAVASRAPRMGAMARRQASHIARVLEIQGEAMFEEEVLKCAKPVLVDYWATWCGPCKLVAPLMDWAEKEYGEKIKVVKVNHTPNPELIAKYKVYGLPTLMVFKDGALVPNSHREGAITKTLLQKYIQDHILAKVNA